MKEVKFEIAHFALRWHVAKDDEWGAMGSERGVFLGEVHPSLTRAEGLRGPSAIRLVIMSALPDVPAGTMSRRTYRQLWWIQWKRKGDMKGSTID